MYLPKEIKLFYHRALAFGIILFLVLPLFLKTLHAYEFHSTQNECKHSTIHFHSIESHNDALEFCFINLINDNKVNDDVFIKNKFKTSYNNYISLLNKQIRYKLRLRGPPFFC